MLNLEEIRKAKGFSQVELAQAIGTSQAFVCELERGKKSPSFDTLLRIAQVLGCTLDELVGRSEQAAAVGG